MEDARRPAYPAPPSTRREGLTTKPNQVATENEHWVVIGSSKNKEVRREMIQHAQPNLKLAIADVICITSLQNITKTPYARGNRW